MFKHFFHDYLVFSRRERIGLICILAVLGGIFFLPVLFSKPEPLTVKTNTIIAQAIDSLQAKEAYSQDDRDNPPYTAYQYDVSDNASFTTGELFIFDPNTIDASGWQRLGLNARTTKTILNYRNKGGKFYKPEDLMKIWGMPEGFYERVKDYISIISVQKSYPPNDYTRPAFEKTERKIVVVNVNEADTSSLIALPGIGSKLAQRILNFREKLGGFYSVEQVGETYGLPDSTFQKIRSRLSVNSNAIKKININTATKDELKAHPYIKWNLANAIVEYRNQHGNFKSLEDLKKIALIDEANFNKIVHYLTIH